MDDSNKGNQINNLIDSIVSLPSEHKTIEMKRLSGSRIVRNIIRAIVAMANADGGLVILGVDDPQKSDLRYHDRIFGIEEDKDKYDELLRELPHIQPHSVSKSDITLLKSSVNQKTIALINVPKAKEALHSYKDEVYIRENISTRRVGPQEYLDLVYAKGFKKADRELVKDVDIQLLDTEWFKAWFANRKLEGEIAEVLLNTGLARKEKGKTLPTRAAVLLFARYPDSLLHDTQCAVRILRYQGKSNLQLSTPNLLGTPITIEGPTIRLIEEVQVLKILASGVKVPSGFVNKYQIPGRAVKEAITNAVIHRDYHIKKDIEVRIFEDRLEVASPGMFVYNITVFNIGKERASDYRNDLLVNQLRQFSDPPNLDINEGVKAMRRDMADSRLYPPTYSTWPAVDEGGLKHYVKVILSNEHAPDEWSKVNEYLQQNAYINNAKAREITSTIQTSKMSAMLKKWIQQGLIERVTNGSQSRRDYRYKLSSRPELEQQLKIS